MPLLPLPPLPLSSHRHSLPFLSLPSSAGRPLRRGDLVIRMGGGPRTFPGGVSKWQWKRMQARKAKQLLKARLARERQLYEMRKRAELREAVLHLERPWDSDLSPVSATALAPNLLSVAADDQLKGLADRFHRPGGVDLWNDRDGPQVFASPDTGKTSARFFPKNAVHSVQPYARLGAGAEGTQGARANDAAEDVYGGREPTVQLMERDGTWEPVTALDGEGDNNSVDRSWINDGVDSDSDDEEDDYFGHEQEAASGVDGRRSGVARRETASTKTVGRDGGRDWRGHGSFSDSEGARRGHLDQRWSDISSGSGSKAPTGRWKPSSTEGSNANGTDRMGGGSFSDSGMSRRSRRARNREDTLDTTMKWKLSYDSHGNVIRKVRISGKLDSNPESGSGDMMEPKWRGPNKFNRSENQRGRPGSNYRPDVNSGERPRVYMNRNSGGIGFASDLDEPTWKPRKKNGFALDLDEPTWKPREKNGGRNNDGSREYKGDMNGVFRRGGSGAARRLDAHTGMHTNGEDGSDHDNRQRIWARLRGDEYSLRPTSELHGSVDKNGRRQFRGDGYSLRPASDLR
ncbi:uncharacterized protein LOC124687336 [Lolium rigidum]|uniref:uncharacterized protein LOC124687336 n=1 Tax=Lolium rigidum TaxID=89674 RepID=UPI001F5D45F6|nr:uncharacterized protein LOC124687336 [Lolium rigidum]